MYTAIYTHSDIFFALDWCYNQGLKQSYCVQTWDVRNSSMCAECTWKKGTWHNTDTMSVQVLNTEVMNIQMLMSNETLSVLMITVLYRQDWFPYGIDCVQLSSYYLVITIRQLYWNSYINKYQP